MLHREDLTTILIRVKNKLNIMGYEVVVMNHTL